MGFGLAITSGDLHVPLLENLQGWLVEARVEMELSAPTRYALRFEDDICDGRHEVADNLTFEKDTELGLFVQLEGGEVRVPGARPHHQGARVIGARRARELGGVPRRGPAGADGPGHGPVQAQGQGFGSRGTDHDGLRLRARRAGDAHRVRRAEPAPDPERDRPRLHRGRGAPQQHGLLAGVRRRPGLALARRHGEGTPEDLARTQAVVGRTRVGPDAHTGRRQGVAGGAAAAISARTSTSSTRGSTTSALPRPAVSR